ncbi:MAG: hypothetical protein ACQEWV_17475 [Bacillota bacterium]
MRTGNTYLDKWNLKDGPQVLEHWGYRVFRYAEIVGAYGAPFLLESLFRNDLDHEAVVY